MDQNFGPKLWSYFSPFVDQSTRDDASILKGTLEIQHHFPINDIKLQSRETDI